MYVWTFYMAIYLLQTLQNTPLQVERIVQLWVDWEILQSSDALKLLMSSIYQQLHATAEPNSKTNTSTNTNMHNYNEWWMNHVWKIEIQRWMCAEEEEERRGKKHKFVLLIHNITFCKYVSSNNDRCEYFHYTQQHESQCMLLTHQILFFKCADTTTCDSIDRQIGKPSNIKRGCQLTKSITERIRTGDSWLTDWWYSGILM